MTVQELIAHLQVLPADSEVRFQTVTPWEDVAEASPHEFQQGYVNYNSGRPNYYTEEEVKEWFAKYKPDFKNPMAPYRMSTFGFSPCIRIVGTEEDY